MQDLTEYEIAVRAKDFLIASGVTDLKKVADEIRSLPYNRADWILSNVLMAECGYYEANCTIVKAPRR